MYRNQITKLLAFTFLFSFVGLVKADEWVWPTMTTAAPVKKELIISTEYKYKLYTATGDSRLPIREKQDSSNDSAYKALVSRMSAIRLQDYDWWLSLWDPVSLELFLEKESNEGRNKDYWLSLWKAQFRDSQIKVRKKVEYENYVIFTYSVLSGEGEDIGAGLEFPIALKQLNGKWFVTLDLRANPLFVRAPWVQGETEINIK